MNVTSEGVESEKGVFVEERGGFRSVSEEDVANDLAVCEDSELDLEEVELLDGEAERPQLQEVYVKEGFCGGPKTFQLGIVLHHCAPTVEGCIGPDLAMWRDWAEEWDVLPQKREGPTEKRLE